MDPSTFKILHDVPSENPSLDFETYARCLAEIVVESRPQFAVGIFGGWGSGKTTLMKAIERRLLEHRGDRVICVWFSAWRYEREEHLIVPLLDTLREALVEWADATKGEAGKAAMATAKTVGQVIHSLLSGLSFKLGVPGALDLSFDANKALAQGAAAARKDREAKIPRSFYHASFQALRSAFREFAGPDEDRRIVVFVDDLDRCLPEAALEVLESMKLFFDLEGFVFVVGLDRDVVEAIVESKYRRPAEADGDSEESGKRIRGADYIKKIFQVPFGLRPVASGELFPFLETICQDAGLSPDQREHIEAQVRPHLDYLVTSSGINPREVKRYLNAYTMQVKLMPEPQEEPREEARAKDLHVALALQTIEFRPDWRQVRKGIYAYRELYTHAVKRQIDGDDPGALDALNPRLVPLPQRFLQYVSGDGPARPLLEETNLDRFIYAGEALRPTVGTGLADAVRRVTSLRDELRTFAADRTGAGLEDLLDGVRKEISDVGTSASHLFQPIERALGAMKASLQAARTDDDERWDGRRESWLEENDRRIDEIVDRLTEMVMGS